MVVKVNSVDAVCVSETWLKEHISSDCVAIPGYQLPFRNDRAGRRSGGACCYIREGLSCEHWGTLKSPSLETVWVTVRSSCMPRSFSHMTFGVIYHDMHANYEGHKEMLEHCAGDFMAESGAHQTDLLICSQTRWTMATT